MPDIVVATPPQNAARIHIIAVLYKSGPSLAVFLDCLKAQTMQAWRLLAVDNASPDRSADLIAGETDPRIRLIRNNANLGFAGGSNVGITAAAAEGADLFLLFNTDTIFGPEFLEHLLAAREEVGAEVMSPRIMLAEQPDKSWYAGGHFSWDWVFSNVHDDYDPADKPTPRVVDFASGCCLLLSRKSLDTVGLLDERFFVYWEDTDFCLRLRQAGVPIHYAPSLTIAHEGGVSSGGDYGRSYSKLYNDSHVRLVHKHFGLLKALATIARLVRAEAARPAVYRQSVSWLAYSLARGLIPSNRSTPRLPATSQPGLPVNLADR
jgi:GT2 family glycosyltransferase